MLWFGGPDRTVVTDLLDPKVESERSLKFEDFLDPKRKKHTQGLKRTVGLFWQT